MNRAPTNRDSGRAWAGAPAHVPALDGLRGLAVMLVLMAHLANFDGPVGLFEQVTVRVTQAGWVGVDLFFVLSGFLITRILLRSRGGEGFFKNFYARRALRIFPLYYGTLFVFFVVLPAASATWHTRIEALPLVVPLGYLTYSWNLISALSRTGLAVVKDPHIGHFWSLNVEEQFYLVWPFLVARLSLRGLARVCVGCFVVAQIARGAMIATGHLQSQVYGFTPDRIDTLAAGALVAVLVEDGVDLARVRRMLRWLAVPACALLAFVVAQDRGILNEGARMQRFGFPAITTLATALLVEVNTGPAASLRARLFTSWPLRMLGRYSYGMYVYHEILNGYFFHPMRSRVLAIVGGPRLLGTAVFFAATSCVVLLVAMASYHAFEEPLLRLKRFFEPAPRDGRVARGGLPVDEAGGVSGP